MRVAVDESAEIEVGLQPERRVSVLSLSLRFLAGFLRPALGEVSAQWGRAGPPSAAWSGNDSGVGHYKEGHRGRSRCPEAVTSNSES